MTLDMANSTNAFQHYVYLRGQMVNIEEKTINKYYGIPVEGGISDFKMVIVSELYRCKVKWGKGK